MCKIIADTKKLAHTEWLGLRKRGIGGSDAGAVCGLNPYSSPMKVFRDKTGQCTEETDNEAIRQGHDLEDYVAQRFTEATGKKVRRSNFMYCHEKYPFMIGDVDRLVVGEDAGLECKTANAYNADKWKDGKIPLHYVIQCYHYMAVTGKKTWYIAAVILGTDFVYRKLAGFDEKLSRREEILSQIEELKKEQCRIEQEVKLQMQEHELAASERYRISWSNVDTARFDTKRFKEDEPELYDSYTKVSSSRRFQVKAA